MIERWDKHNNCWSPNPVARMREEMGLTQGYFAAKLKVSPALISAVERGAVAEPKKLWQAMDASIPGMQTANSIRPAYERWCSLEPKQKPAAATVQRFGWYSEAALTRVGDAAAAEELES